MNIRNLYKWTTKIRSKGKSLRVFFFFIPTLPTQSYCFLTFHTRYLFKVTVVSIFYPMWPERVTRPSGCTNGKNQILPLYINRRSASFYFSHQKVCIRNTRESISLRTHIYVKPVNETMSKSHKYNFLKVLTKKNVLFLERYTERSENEYFYH